MNATINNTINSVENSSKIGGMLTDTSKWITEKVTNLISKWGLEVTQRWSSILILFTCMGIVYVALKISKPFIKWTLIILGVLLILGLLIPSW